LTFLLFFGKFATVLQKLQQIKKQKLTAILFLIITLFTVAYVSIEKNHHCTQEDCQICLIINMAEQNLKLVSLTIASAFCLTAVIKTKTRTTLISTQPCIYLKTLIAQKVRLNN